MECSNPAVWFATVMTTQLHNVYNEEVNLFEYLIKRSPLRKRTASKLTGCGI